MILKVSTCFPLIIKMLLTMLYIYYIYAIIGMKLFNRRNIVNPLPSPYSMTENYADFETFDGALLTLF